MRILILLATAIACVPGVLFTIPPGHVGVLQWAVHIAIFIGLYKLLLPSVFVMFEGFENPNTRTDAPCPAGYVKCKSGDCKRKGDKFSPCS